MGVIVRRTLGPPFGAHVYELTEWGLSLEPVLQALGRWGARSPAMPHVASVGSDTVILALRIMFDIQAAQGVDVTLELRIGIERFRAVVAHGALTVERGGASNSDAVIWAEPSILAGFLLRSLAERRDRLG